MPGTPHVGPQEPSVPRASPRRRATGPQRAAKALKGARWALWKNPENLTHNQQQAGVDREDQPQALPGLPAQRRPAHGVQLPLKHVALDRWLSWARRCRISAFVKLAKTITKHRAPILAAIEHGLSNGRIESANTKIRLITRVAFGFKSPEALIALAMLNLGGHRPMLPGRS